MKKSRTEGENTNIRFNNQLSYYYENIYKTLDIMKVNFTMTHD